MEFRLAAIYRTDDDLIANLLRIEEKCANTNAAPNETLQSGDRPRRHRGQT